MNLLNRTAFECKKCFKQALGIMGTCSIWGLMLNPAAAASFQTTFSLPVISPPSQTFTTLVIDWAGSDVTMDGLISFDDGEYESFALTLLDGNDVVVFEDVIVENFQLMDFDGVPRSLNLPSLPSDPFNPSNFPSNFFATPYMFNGSTELFNDESNTSVVSVGMLPGTPSEVVFNFVFTVREQLAPIGFLPLPQLETFFVTGQPFDLWSSGTVLVGDGGSGGSGGDGGDDDSDVVVSTPEPNLMLGFITLGGVLLGSKRKTKG